MKRKTFGSFSVMHVDNKGMDFVLNACGYPVEKYMYKDLWNQWHAHNEGRCFVEDAEEIELEYELNGIRGRTLNSPIWYYKDNSADPEWEEWENYMSAINSDNYADELLNEYEDMVLDGKLISLCNGNFCTGSSCPKGTVCPWATWEYGMLHEYIPTQSEIEEGASPVCRFDPCEYEIIVDGTTEKRSNIEDAITIANIAILKEAKKISIIRDYDILFEKK